MLASAIYLDNLGNYIFKMPDNSFAWCRADLNRRIKRSDLTPIDIAEKELYLAKSKKLSFSSDIEPQLRTLGVSTNPIRAARYDLRLSQTELASLVGVSKRRIQIFEQEGFDLGRIRAKNAVALSDVLGIDLNIFC